LKGQDITTAKNVKSSKQKETEKGIAQDGKHQKEQRQQNLINPLLFPESSAVFKTAHL
jgi:hypothetical protein